MLKAGQQFGNFLIEKKLGEGGMGAVYLAMDQKLNRPVALKILLSEYFDDAEHRERFYREAKTAAQVSNPNVMAIHDIGNAPLPDSDRELHYIVMEYVEGTSLSSVLKDGKPDMATLLRYAGKIASGLAAAHQKGIVHRDIKTENIIIDVNREPKILDFGLAKPVDPVQFEKGDDSTRTVSQELTRAGKILGTVNYMSPEQVRGEKVDNRSDIFSFGILLYQMVTGAMPFAGKTQVSTLAKILESQPEPPHLKNADIPAELERIINKCLQKDAADRYQDTRDLVVDIRSLRRQFDSGVTDTISGITSGIGTAVSKPAKSFMFNLSWKLVILVGFCVVIAAGVIEKCIDVVDTRSDSTNVRQTVRDALEGLDDVEMPEEARMALRGLTGNTKTVAIESFSNKTGDESLDWMETGLPEILVTDLAQIPRLVVISRDRVFERMGKRTDEQYDRDDYLEAAEELGARKLLAGSFFKVGDQIRIDARLEDISTGKIVLGEKVVGVDPFTLIDSLTTKIATSLDVGQAMPEGMGASKFAGSMESYKEYHEGMKLFGQSRWDEAQAQFDKTIAMDSSFALPYMRNGMIKVFQGRQQEGQVYFQHALKYRDKLPRRDRIVLDIYSDLWLHQQYESAYQKIKSFVKEFPTDAEGRTFYAILLDVFETDTIAAFAQLDTALAIDPGFSFAMQQYAELKSKYGDNTTALKYRKKLVKDFPESSDILAALGRQYRVMGDLDKAIETFEEMVEKFPEEPNAINALYILHVRKREFGKARQYIQMLPKRTENDPFEMDDYYVSMGNLSAWEGKFREKIAFLHKAYDETVKTGDPNLQWGALSRLRAAFEFLDMDDSALVYLRKSYEVANAFQRVNFPVQMVELDPGSCDEMRPIFQNAVRDFEARLTGQMAEFGPVLSNLFEATCTSDTAELIKQHREILRIQPGQTGGNERSLGVLLILFGGAEEGVGILEDYVTGNKASSSAATYLITSYYLGRGYEELGRKKDASERYREMLQFWSDPDIEIKEIVDARERLARLGA